MFVEQINISVFYQASEIMDLRTQFDHWFSLSKFLNYEVLLL